MKNNNNKRPRESNAQVHNFSLYFQTNIIWVMHDGKSSPENTIESVEASIQNFVKFEINLFKCFPRNYWATKRTRNYGSIKPSPHAHSILLKNIMIVALENDQEYFISSTISTGSEGKVYTAIDRKTNEKVAIKIILLPSKQQKIKFENHIQLINNISEKDHPHLCKLFDCKVRELNHTSNNKNNNVVEIGYIVMKLYDCDLFTFALRSKSGFLSELEAKPIFRKICLGVQCLHDSDISHLDLKPENVLMANGIPCICDFGSSSVYKAGTFITQSSLIRKSISKGTWEYLPPETLKMGDTSFCPKKRDIFSLGVLLHVILCGFFPYDVNDRVRTVNIDENISPACNNLLSWMLQSKPENRPNIAQVVENYYLINKQIC